ncbi:MAG: hypothetical protein AAFX93_15665 [Verrucomicrobiota bacterium]
MKAILHDMTQQERVAWVTVAITSLVAVYYCMNVPISLTPDDLYSRSMRQVVSICLALAIGMEILSHFLSRSNGDKTEEDERDIQIREKATTVAHNSMIGFAVLLIVQIVFLQGITRASWGAGLDLSLLGELGVANLLLRILILTSIIQHLAIIIYYRRGV